MVFLYDVQDCSYYLVYCIALKEQPWLRGQVNEIAPVSVRPGFAFHCHSYSIKNGIVAMLQQW